MKMRLLIGVIGLVAIVMGAQAQDNLIIQEVDENANLGFEYFDRSLYAHVNSAVKDYLEKPEKHPFGDYEKNRREATLLGYIADLRINDPRAESRLKYHVLEFYPDPVTIPAILELGSHYYYQGDYQDAIDWYDKLELDQLPGLDQSEASFKKGYCLFVKKQFQQSKYTLSPIIEKRNIFYYPSNYYYGMNQYFLNDYQGAVASFKKVANSDYYGNYIPYYLSQIYFAQKKYDLLISYAEQKITEPAVKNKKDIRLLLGQAYFLRNDYKRALTHLEFYEANTERLTIEEFYQLAFTQYQLGHYAKAKDIFAELTYQETSIGQISNYYLADCYVKLGDKPSARAIFKKVASMDFEPSMKHEALFNYGKISAELGYEREGINILKEIDEKSPFYKESQDIIYDILANSGDYENSIEILESLPSLNEKLQLTYQNVTLKRGLQYFNAAKPDLTKKYLTKSMKYPVSRNYLSQAYYWMARMDYSEQKYASCLEWLTKYHSSANGVNDLPEESRNFMASYLEGYCWLKKEDYKQAEVRFKNSIIGINLRSADFKNENLSKRILPDAMLRASDCMFKQGNYEGAKSFYAKIIELKNADLPYALYQSAMIEGLMGEPYQKLVYLDEIVKNSADSDYGDDAYFQIGETYFGMESIEPAASAYIELMSKYGPSSPFYADAQLKMGLINYNKGDFNGALDYYKSVFNFHPSPSQKISALKGIEEIYINDLGKANLYIQFVESLPGFEMEDISKDSLSYFTAFNHYDQGEDQKALDAFNDYLSLYPEGIYRSDASYYRGELNLTNKAYVEALKDFESVIETGTTAHREIALKKAAVLAFNSTKEFDKSLKYYGLYEKETSNETERYKAQFGAMQSSYLLGQNNDIILFAQKVNTNPLASKEERALALFYIGKVNFITKDFEPSLAAFSQVSKMLNDEKAAEANYRIAQIYFNTDQLELAEKQCHYNTEESISYPFWVAKSILLLSDVYIAKKDLINARAAIEAILENFDDENLTKSAQSKLQLLEKLEKDADRVKSMDSDTLELDSGDGNE